MKKTYNTTPQISVISKTRGQYYCYSLYINGKWENDYHSLDELQQAFLALVVGVYVYAD